MGICMYPYQELGINADNIMLFIKNMTQEHDFSSTKEEDTGEDDYRMIPVVKNVIYPKALLPQYL